MVNCKPQIPMGNLVMKSGYPCSNHKINMEMPDYQGS